MMSKNVFMYEKWPDNILHIVAPQLKLPQTKRQKRGFERAISRLTDRERDVLYLRAMFHCSQKVTAKELGITPTRVGQVQKKVIRKLSVKPLNDLILYGGEESRKLGLEDDIDELTLSVRAYNCLRRKHLDTIGDVVNYFSNNTYGSVRNMGEKTYVELCEVIFKRAGIKLPEISQYDATIGYKLKRRQKQ